MLTHGDVHKARAIMQRRGLPIPDDMYPPAMLPGAGEWLAAFKELSNDRQIGMGLGPIPASSIDQWPVDEGERDSFRACIRAMDAEYLSHAKGDRVVQADTKNLLTALRERG